MAGDGLVGYPLGVWCNWQHNGFWYRHSRFESWYPSCESGTILRIVSAVVKRDNLGSIAVLAPVV